MAWWHLHIYVFIKLRIHKCIDSIILDEFKIKPCGNCDESAEASSGKSCCIGILSIGASLLVTPDNKARLTFKETPVFIKLVEIYPHAIEDLLLLRDRTMLDFDP